MTLRPKTAAPLGESVCHKKLPKVVLLSCYNSLSIDEKSLKNIKIDLEITFNVLQMTLGPKTPAPLCLTWKKYQNLYMFLSSSSYNSLSIADKAVKKI